MVGASLTIDLCITARDGDRRLRRSLSKGEVLRIGRSPEDGLKVPWDKKISRERADVYWDGDRLHVRCVESARNPIIYNSQLDRTISVFCGERFTIGATTFAVLTPGANDVSNDEVLADDDPAEMDGEPALGPDVVEQSYSSHDLSGVSFGNTDRQMELLAGLPGMISTSQSDEELATRLARLLLQALPAADGVAVAHFDEASLPLPGASSRSLPKPVMMRIETRPGFRGRFRPSRRLLLTTVASTQNAMHLWGDDGKATEYTMTEGLGWAFATPIRVESCRGWCLYVSGKGSSTGGISSLKVS
ncbi:MAG: hypothetical protein CMJ64_12705 [Planctomycetaceae bacterium]|nr:hypothetical protein [Planctomycetaceae bacterium]